jgi:hypothetical protein
LADEKFFKKDRVSGLSLMGTSYKLDVKPGPRKRKYAANIMAEKS